MSVDGKISNDAAATVGASAVFPGVQGGTNKKFAASLFVLTEDTTEYGRGLVDAADAASAQAILDLRPGVDVQAYNADLSAIEELSKGDGNFIVADGSTWTVESGATARESLGLAIGVDVQAYSPVLAEYDTVNPTAAGLALLDDADAAAQRTTLGLGSAAVANLLDEDNMASNSAIDAPSQKSVRAYALSLAGSGVRWITQSIRVRSTGNVDLSNGLENGDTLNGVTLATGDHVFLGLQTDTTQNGIYTVVASGAASRATFADSAAELEYMGFVIQSGTTGAGERWILPLAAADINIGVTALQFAPHGIEPGYQGEVVAARGGRASIGDRFDDIDDEISDARGGEASLADALAAISDRSTAKKLITSSGFAFALADDGNNVLGGLDENLRWRGAGDFYTVTRCVDPAYDGITVVDVNGKVISASAEGAGTTSWASALIGSIVYAISEDAGLAIPVSWQRTGTPIAGSVDNDRRKLTYAVDDGGTITPFAEWTDYVSAQPPGVDTLRAVFWHGQSLGMGDQATPVISSPASGTSRALTFNDGARVINVYATSAYADVRLPEDALRSIVPTFEDNDGAAGETPCSGFAKYLADKLADNVAVLSATVAVGGTGYNSIKAGTTSYDNLLRLVRRGAFIAAGNGLSYDVPAICWKHGESNSSVSAATYQGYLEELAADLQTDIPAITGQADGPVLVTSQYTSWGKFSVTRSGPALALLEAALDNPTEIICAGPDYVLPHSADDVHLTALGSLRAGEYAARAVETFLDSGSWLPLHPTAAVRTADTIVVTFHVPLEPIVLDTTTLTDPGNRGIEWIDNGDGNAVTISSVTKTGDDELTVVLSATPTATGQKLGFARTTTLGVGSNINVGPRTNIRDSSTDISIYDGANLYNWCCVSEIDVTT